MLTMILKADTDAAVPAWFSEAIAAPVAERATAHDGVSIAYRMWGGPVGRAVILVHGGGAHSRWWDHIAPLLAAGRRVIAVDLSGHGESGRRESYNFDVWADEILAVMADAGLDAPPVVIGHSMGGLVSLRLAALAGSRIEGAVVVDSPIRDMAPEEQAARRQRVFRQLRVYPTREAILARFRPVPDQPVLGYIADHVAATSIRQADGGWTWKWDPRVFGRTERAVALTRLDCRVALFRAEHGILSAEMSDITYDQLGRVAPVIEIPAAGHHVMLDQPIALVAALRTLLSDWDHSLPAQPRGPEGGTSGGTEDGAAGGSAQRHEYRADGEHAE
jgi:pimeloyl-ACP methyl ester carboxylesterase